MMSTLGIPRTLGAVIIGVFIASFAGTTLDSATRIQRYVISELATNLKMPAIGNRWAATAIAIVSTGVLAFSTGAGGKGAMTLWPMFGAVNQLLAALALMLVTLYLKRKGGLKYLLTGLPCLFMLVMTSHAMVYNEIDFLRSAMNAEHGGGQWWLLVLVNGTALILALWMVVEGLQALLKKSGPPAEPEEESNTRVKDMPTASF